MGPPDYKAVPQSLTAPMPMRNYNSSPKIGYSPEGTEYFGNDSAEAPLTGIRHHLHHHRKLLLREDDLVSFNQSSFILSLTHKSPETKNKDPYSESGLAFGCNMYCHWYRDPRRPDSVHVPSHS